MEARECAYDERCTAPRHEPRSGVAEKPQAGAIRAETLERELIVTGSARSVGRGAIIRPRGTARAMMGERGGSRPQGLGYAFISAAFAGHARRGTARCDSRRRDPDRDDVTTSGAQPPGAARHHLARRARYVRPECRAGD